MLDRPKGLGLPAWEQSLGSFGKGVWPYPMALEVSTNGAAENHVGEVLPRLNQDICRGQPQGGDSCSRLSWPSSLYPFPWGARN